MTVDKKLTLVFMFFYIAVIVYLLLFFFVLDVQIVIIKGRKNIASLTEGTNYFWALIIVLIVCLIGSASIGFPVPFPFILFSMSNSIYLKYSNRGLNLSQILATGPFWLEIMGIAIAGGLGSALGELTSFILGIGAKRIAEKNDSLAFENIQGFGKLVLDHPNRMYFYIFVAAALPIPDDPIWIALGMSERKFKLYKCLLAGWLGKTITTTFYVLLPILLLLGISASGMEVNDVSAVITEAIMLLLTLTIMFFILAFNWNKYFENKQKTAKTIKN